jgi:hypothetical protein
LASFFQNPGFKTLVSKPWFQNPGFKTLVFKTLGTALNYPAYPLNVHAKRSANGQMGSNLRIALRPITTHTFQTTARQNGFVFANCPGLRIRLTFTLLLYNVIAL